MSTRFQELFADLAAPFDPREVKVRTQGGRALHYITARVAMNRLDNVLGPENWWDDYVPGENSVLCRLTIVIPEEGVDPASWRTLTKTDAGGYAGMADQGDDDKSGFSDSFKRAAVKFGVGRYLYRDGVPFYAADAQPEADPRPPARSQERPSSRPADRRPDSIPTHVNTRPAGNGAAPRSGRALFAWTKEQEQRHEVALLKHLNDWAKRQGFPGRMVDWNEDEVRAAHDEAVRKIQTVTPAPEEIHEEALAN